MATTSAFLDLPGEIRNQIYEEYAASMTLQIRNNTALEPPLSQTCRQVRKELMSILHRCLFHTSPLEVRIIDWDFDPVFKILSKMKAHDNGNTRPLKIYIDVYTPAANYSPQRFKWCTDARFALAWYAEDPDRAVDLVSNRFAPVRLKIADQFFDVSYVIRFPPSRFSLDDRFVNEDWYDKFIQTYLRTARSRPLALNCHLERNLDTASQACVFVASYWARYEAWIMKLRMIQEAAWMMAQERQRWELELELGRQVDLQEAMALRARGPLDQLRFIG